MRTSALFFSAVFAAAVPAAAQQPLITLAPPPAPIYGPRTVIPASLACVDVPVTAHQAAPLHIAAPHTGDAHEFSYRDDVVVLNGGTPEGLMPGQRFFARRLLPPRSGAPVSEFDPGLVHTAGWLTVIAADEHSALARIDYACDAVAAGDYLEPYVEPTLPEAVATATESDFSNLARVLQGRDRHESFGAGDFLSINRGASQNITAGTRVAFYRDRRNGTPLVEIGTGIVMEVSPDTAKVVVDRARVVVQEGDYVAIRR